MIVRRTLLPIAALLLLAAPGRAAFVTYEDRAAFLAAAPPVTTETFDEFQVPTSFPSPAIFDGVTYLAPPLGGSYWVVENGDNIYPPESPPNVLEDTNTIGTIAMHLAGNSVAAFGFALVVPVVPPEDYPANYLVTIYETDGLVTTRFESFPDAGPRYLGFVETGPGVGIAEVTITPNSTNLGLDDVSHSDLLRPVPEPASLVLLATGLAGVGMIAVRRKGTRHAC